MNKNYRVLVGLALGIFTLNTVGCGNIMTPVTPQLGPSPNPGSNSGNGYTAAQSDNLLCGSLYGQLQPTSGNLFFSPFSIITALAMVDEGAKKQTKAQIESTLFLQTNDTQRQQGFQQLITEINAPGKAFQLSTSNDLWVEQTFPILPSYLNVTGQYYSAGVTHLDFINDPSGSAQTINDTVSNQTNGKITNLVPASSITPNMKLILTNAIYFKADWAQTFEANMTNQQPFFTDPSTSKPVSMMHQTRNGAIEDYHGVAEVLELPYQNNEVSMFVFLPPEGGTAALEAQMTPQLLSSWFATRVPPAMSVTQVVLSLPKFTYSTSYDLKPTLQQLGMTQVFTNQADLSGIDGANPPDLKIDFVLHKAFVAVDEKGTEAAAATAVGIIGFTSVYMPTPLVPFTVDHPFLFVLYENTSKAVLFMGRVNDPTQN